VHLALAVVYCVYYLEPSWNISVYGAFFVLHTWCKHTIVANRCP